MILFLEFIFHLSRSQEPLPKHFHICLRGEDFVDGEPSLSDLIKIDYFHQKYLPLAVQ